MTTAATVLTQAAGLGQGTLDNFIINPGIHRLNGMIVLATLVAATAWSIRLALAKKPWDLTATVLTVAAQVFLVLQALLGIKLLDQGMGILQLYIHYVGGLVPLGLYLAISWLPYRDQVRRVRVVAAATTVGLVSAAMAFFIGQAFVSGGGGLS